MNKDAFYAGLATLQAQLDAAERTMLDAKFALRQANIAYRAAKADLAGHLAYGKARGWIERAKRSKPEPVAEAAE